jgi:hypothetical protein
VDFLGGQEGEEAGDQGVGFLGGQPERDEEGGGEAENEALQHYIDALPVSLEEPPTVLPPTGPLQPPEPPVVVEQSGIYQPGAQRQNHQQKWPRVSGAKRIELLKQGMYHSNVFRVFFDSLFFLGRPYRHEKATCFETKVSYRP